MKNIFKKLSTLLVLCLFSSIAHAAWPLSLGLSPFSQFPEQEATVVGLRFGLWTLHSKVYGLDVGVLSMTDKEFQGLQIGVFGNINMGKTVIYGLQFGGLANWNGPTDVYGMQASMFFNISGKSKTTVQGLQISMIGNTGANYIHGVQVSFFNEAQYVKGLQIGIINKAKTLKGVQIGLLNFIEKGGIPVFPIINAAF